MPVAVAAVVRIAGVEGVVGQEREAGRVPGMVVAGVARPRVGGQAAGVGVLGDGALAGPVAGGMAVDGLPAKGVGRPEKQK